jgi:hypothetical protein
MFVVSVNESQIRVTLQQNESPLTYKFIFAESKSMFIFLIDIKILNVIE